MLNLSDNELDRLSKEASEHYKAPAVQSFWEKLSRRLDIEMPKDKKYRRRIALFILLFLLLAGGAGYYFTNTEKEAANVKQAQDKSAVRVLESPEQKSGNERKTDSEIQKIEYTENQTKVDLTHVQNQPQPVAGSFSLSQGRNNSNENDALRDEKRRDYKNSDNRIKNPVIPDKDDEKTDQAEKNKLNSQSEPDKISNPLTITEVTITPKTEVPPIEATVKENKKQTQFSSLRKWEIGLVFSPDLSNVKFSHSDKTGTNAGITIGYNINRRWSVNSGLLYTIKNYTTSGDNYKFPPSYWATNPSIKMEQVKAVCTMFDIPVNVRYNWLVRKNQSAFISAGLSSYLMNKEEFEYKYTYYNNPYRREWTNGKNSNYFFSVANISVGYEQQVGPAISLQAEPFFKFSISEIGFGKVPLNSLGMFIGVKYKPAFGKKAAAKIPVVSEK